MNRKNIEQFDEKAIRTPEHQRRNKKIRIEKGIVAAAIIVILMALLVIPKYEAYRENKLILAEKENYNSGLPDEMTEESYIKQLEIIGEQLNETRTNLPESLDTVRLYESVAKMAESAKVSLTSLEFGLPKIEIDDQLGMKIDKDFMENEEKIIVGPDSRFLTTCEFVVVCSGNDDTFMAFLTELNQGSPVIRIISYEIEAGSADEKQMCLKLESYAVQEADLETRITEAVD
ncbi:MAG: hypothetical protein ABGU93_04650 [Acetobacterium sp.]|uniref:hypothetical protein n=1 Tax=Acetobacterium sp. TaxID=1872094 RepID=UPI003242619D